MRHIDPYPLGGALIAFAALISTLSVFRTRSRRRARRLFLALWAAQFIILLTCAAALTTGADLLFYTSGAAALIVGIAAFAVNVIPQVTPTRENP